VNASRKLVPTFAESVVGDAVLGVYCWVLLVVFGSILGGWDVSLRYDLLWFAILVALCVAFGAVEPRRRRSRGAKRLP
jgi:hypothetical protein